MRKIDLRFYLDLMRFYRMIMLSLIIFFGQLHQMILLLVFLIMGGIAPSEAFAQNNLEKTGTKSAQIAELYYSTFISHCQDGQDQNAQIHQTQLLTYSALYFTEPINEIKSPKVYIEALEQEVRLQALDESESHLWLIAIDSAAYQLPKQREDLKKQIELIKKQLSSKKDLILLFILDFNQPQSYKKLLPTYANMVDLDRFFTSLEKAVILNQQFGIPASNIDKIMDHINGLKDQLETWASLLQTTKYIYVNHCATQVTGFHPKVNLLIFTNLNTTSPANVMVTTKAQQDLAQQQKAFEQTIRSPRSPIFGLHILPISHQKLISESPHLLDLIQKNRILPSKHKLYLSAPSESDLVSAIANIQEIDQQIKLMELVSIDSKYWLGEHLKLKVSLNTPVQNFEGQIEVELKPHQSKLIKALEQKNLDLSKNSKSIEQKNEETRKETQESTIDEAPLVNAETQEFTFHLSEKMMYMLGISLSAILLLLVYLLKKSSQAPQQFQPIQEQLLNPTRQISDYIAIDQLHSDSKNPSQIIHHLPKQNTPHLHQSTSHLPSIQMPQNSQQSEILISDRVDQEKEREDLKTFKPHWSKPDQKAEVKSPEIKSPEIKSPEIKSLEIKSPAFTPNVNPAKNQSAEEDWFKGTHERERSSSTSQIIQKLANPHNLSQKPKNQEQADSKSVPVTYQASSPNTQEIRQLAYLKKPEHYYAVLEAISGPMKDCVYFITQRETSVGRALDATCPLPPSGKDADLAISRYHFSLFKYPNRWHLRCTSSQPMYVNQEQITKGDEIELEDLDRIRIGQTLFVFKINKN